MPPKNFPLGRIITRGRRYIAEVDGLRFLAIMGVLFCHLSAYTLSHSMAGAAVYPSEAGLPAIFGTGGYGVQLFFGLSGFLLAMPFAKWRLGLATRPSLRTYYLRRLSRLEPPYMLAMLVLFAGGFAAYGFTAGLAHWPNLLASLIYQHNLIFGEPSLITGVAWSLEIEVQFYLLAPLLASVFSIPDTRVRRSLMLAAMTLLPLARSVLPGYLARRYNSLPWHLEFFATGFLLADLYLMDWKEAPKRSLRWDAASLVAWPVLIAFMLRDSPQWFPVPILLACIGAFRGRLSSWLLSRPLITTIGGMCYSMYLLHFSVISVTGRLTNRALLGSNFCCRFAMVSILAIPCVFAATGLYFMLLERPCMDPSWPVKLLNALRPTASSGTSPSACRPESA